MIPVLLADVLAAAVARAEAHVAVAHSHRVLTYGELDGISGALCLSLEQHGVRAGSRVAVALGGIEAVVAFWAIAKIGAVGVPFDPHDADLAAGLRNAEAQALVVDAGLAPTFHHAVARAPSLGVVIVRGHDTSEATGSAVWVAWETAIAEEDPVSRSEVRRVDLDTAWLALDEEGDRCAISHRALLSRAASLVRGLGIEPRDTIAGSSFAELAVAAAAATACLGRAARDGRALWISADDDDTPAPEGATELVVYGSVTCGPVALESEGNEPARVLPNVDVAVLDDAGKHVAPKVVGEIAVRSSGVLAADAPGGYFRTGDSGMLDDAGALYIL